MLDVPIRQCVRMFEHLHKVLIYLFILLACTISFVFMFTVLQVFSV